LDLLRFLFPQFNRQFFGGELPDYEIRVEPLIGRTIIIIKLRNGKYRPQRLGANDLYGSCIAEEQLIFIGSQCAALEDEFIREVLLHEMCHAAVSRNAPKPSNGNPHGPEFVAELRRLAALGEAWAGEEAQYYQTVPLDHQAVLPLDAWRTARNA